jgi:hypothetical protein
MWALGVCIHVWIFGCLPFDGATSYATYTAIQTCDLHLPGDAGYAGSAGDVRISPALGDVLRCLLDKRPSSRPTAAQLLDHPWLAHGSAGGGGGGGTPSSALATRASKSVTAGAQADGATLPYVASTSLWPASYCRQLPARQLAWKCSTRWKREPRPPAMRLQGQTRLY